MSRNTGWAGIGFDAWMLGFESSMVIASRMMMFAIGAPGAGAEANRMIGEKLAAAGEWQVKAMTGGLGATPQAATRKTIAGLRTKVRRNRRRLARKRP